VGNNAGLALTTGSSCTFLGASTNTSLDSATNSTAIGAGASFDGSNMVVLGNSSVTLVRAGATNSVDLGSSSFVWRDGWFNNVRVTANNGLIFTNQTTGAGSATGSLTNAPVAGNPAFWLRVQINGVNRFIPAW
jgi:hypothetical protein